MDVMPKWVDDRRPAGQPDHCWPLILSAWCILAIGEDPMVAIKHDGQGALGSSYGWGYTLYYATNFIFTGLAVAVAFHARLFNIGGEGQAMLGGSRCGAVCLVSLPWPHWTLALPAAMLGGGAFRCAWAAIPAYLQAKRGSHIVITTIMFNFIARVAELSAGQRSASTTANGSGLTRASPRGTAPAHLPVICSPAPKRCHFSAARRLNVTFFIAILACFLVWLLIWRTRLGYEIRAFGHSETAAVYAGISAPRKIIMIAMLISGALAGLMAINNVMGEAERLVLNAVEGAGFIGIAVALMGRSHPLGVLIAALLFGFLFQGGAELGLWTKIPREMMTGDPGAGDPVHRGARQHDPHAD